MSARRRSAEMPMAAQRAPSSWEIHNGNDLAMELHGDVEVEFVESFFGEEVGGG